MCVCVKLSLATWSIAPRMLTWRNILHSYEIKSKCGRPGYEVRWQAWVQMRLAITVKPYSYFCFYKVVSFLVVGHLGMRLSSLDIVSFPVLPPKAVAERTGNTITHCIHRQQTRLIWNTLRNNITVVVQQGVTAPT